MQLSHLYTVTLSHKQQIKLLPRWYWQHLPFQIFPSPQHLLSQHLCKITFQRLSGCTRCFCILAEFLAEVLASLDKHVTLLCLVLQIILQTAKFVQQAGGQTEFVLRVKQAANPNFSFLEPNDQQHPYFRWLVSTKPEVHRHSASMLPAYVL